MIYNNLPGHIKLRVYFKSRKHFKYLVSFDLSFRKFFVSSDFT